MNQTEDEEDKKMSETETFQGYEGEGMENAPEGLGFSISERSVSVDICEPPKSYTEENETSVDTYEEKKKLLLKEKWLTVTGRKPRNIPNLRKNFDQTAEEVVFFGDRRPADVEKKIREKLLSSSRKLEESKLKFGKIALESLLPPFFGDLMSIKLDPNHKFLASADRRGLIQVRAMKTAEVLYTLETIESSMQSAIRCLKFNPADNEKLYAAGDTGTIQVFDTTSESKEVLCHSEPLGLINNIDISSDGNYLAAVGRQGRVHVVDPYTFQVISQRSWPIESDPIPYGADALYHRLRVYGVRFHPTNTNLFVTGGWDNVKIWDIRTTPAIYCIKGPAVYGDGVDISDDRIITASWKVEGSLNLYDFPSRRLIKNIPIKVKSTKYDGEFLYSCRFFNNEPAYPSVNSDMVATGGSGFSNIIVINVSTNEVKEYFPSFKPVLSMDISGNLIAYGGKESLLRVAEVVSRRK